eukprot:2096316-Pleurochrysis_carterae.AAC.1
MNGIPALRAVAVRRPCTHAWPRNPERAHVHPHQGALCAKARTHARTHRALVCGRPLSLVSFTASSLILPSAQNFVS